MDTNTSGRATIAPVRQRVVVNAPVERAFSLFTDGFGTWWPKSHTIARAPVERAIIEPRAGGRCYDLCTDGSTCDWGQVLAWEPPGRLVLAWQIDGTWSYEPDPEHASRVTISFAARGDGRTEVMLVHDEFERHLTGGADLAAGVRDGWAAPLQAFAAATEAAATEADTTGADTTGADTEAATTEGDTEADTTEANAEAATGGRGTEPAPPARKYVLTYRSVDDYLPLAQQHYPAHRARLDAFHARGDLLMVGLLEDPVNGDAMSVFTSQAAAVEFVAGDPFVLNKVVASWTIRPWQEVLYRQS